MAKFWLDDVRPAPEGWVRAESVEELKEEVLLSIDVAHYFGREIEIVVSLDNDLGEGMTEGYKFLDWMEENGYNFVIHIHTSNPVARERMRAIIERNGWEEVR